jgi:hypothetical protein
MAPARPWALFGIQEIGLLVEDPFQPILKLEVTCEAITTDTSLTRTRALAARRRHRRAWACNFEPYLVGKGVQAVRAPVALFVDWRPRYSTA